MAEHLGCAHTEGRAARARAMLLDVFKEAELIETIALSASKRIYTVGRQQGVSDIPLMHTSISREHATLTVSSSGKVVVTDLNSAQGTWMSGKQLPARKPHLVAPGRSLVFGKSTRVFKLRAGEGAAYVGGDAPARAPTSASPLGQALLHELRGDAPGTIRLRPDGFARLSDLLTSAAAREFRAAESEVQRALDALGIDVERRRIAEGAELVRARAGHASTSRVDVTLDLRAPSDAELGAIARGATEVVHGAGFAKYNALRSAGIGCSEDGPIRLATGGVRKGRPLPGATKPADLMVRVDGALLLCEEGVELLIDVAATAAAAEAEFGQAGAEAERAAGAGAASGVAEGPSLGDEGPPLALVTMGDAAGVVGTWLFRDIVSGRNGSVMMGADEVAPIRQARAREAAAAEAQRAAAAEKAAAKEEARRRRAEAAAAEAAAEAEPAFNPYLAHIDDAPPSKASNKTAAAPLRGKRKAATLDVE